jgi:hypothetical protein
MNNEQLSIINYQLSMKFYINCRVCDAKDNLRSAGELKYL